MERNHLGIIHLVDVVAGEHHHILGVIALDEGDVLGDGVGRALIPVGALALLVRGQHMHARVHAVQVPGLAGADVFVQLQGLVLGEHAYGLNAGIDAVGKGKINDAVFAAKGHGGLGQVLGQNPQPAALAARKQHGYDLLFG